MKKTIPSLILAGAMALTSCTAEHHSRKGDRDYEKLAYVDAIKHYEKARKKGNHDKSLLANLGDSYRKIEQTPAAAGVYRHLAKSNKVNEYDLYYGQVLMELGNYELAKPYLESFAAQNKNDERAQNLLKACKTTEKLRVDRGQYDLVPTNLNSAASDFGPVLYQDQLYFSSARSKEQLQFSWDKSSFLDLYAADFNGNGNLGTPHKLPNKINSRFHEAIPAFSPDGQTMLFTRNNYFGGKAGFSKASEVKLQMYETNRKGKRWGKIKPFPYNDSEYSVGHPSLSSDGQRLYFASDMPGGLGGVDLYKCEREGDSWGKPTNLGAPLNTEGDEMFPSLDGDGILIFASNGHPGLGGLDLYSVRTGSWSDIQHLGAPLNSKADDFQMVLAPSGKMGFFTSNREGGKGLDDIYAFERLPAFKGTILAKGDSSLETAMVSIQSQKGESINPLVEEDGTFDCGLKPGTYMVSIRQPGFEPYQQKLVVPSSTVENQEQFELTPRDDCEQFEIGLLAKTELNGMPDAGQWVRVSMNDILIQTDGAGEARLNLPPGFEYEVVLEGSTGSSGKASVSTKGVVTNTEIPVVLSASTAPVTKDTIVDLDEPNFEDPFYIIYYDYDQSDIRSEDARPELDRLVRYMDRNPAIKVVLTSHTDSRGDDAYNLALSKRRAQEAYAYILKTGIGRDRLFYNYEGERAIANECGEGVPCSEEKHQQNRRTEFRLKE